MNNYVSGAWLCPSFRGKLSENCGVPLKYGVDNVTGNRPKRAHTRIKPVDGWYSINLYPKGWKAELS